MSGGYSFMSVGFYGIIFAFGLVIGSFLNCLVYRLEQDEKITGRSYCPGCKHPLMWLDLIPVFSFLFLRGRCRYCKKKISAQYPFVELLTAIVFVLLYTAYLVRDAGDFIGLLFSFYIASSFIAIFVYDVKHFLIPDIVLLPAIALTVAYELIFSPHFLLFNSLWAALFAFLFFWIIFFISQEKWMGFGDCKLAILLGLVLGFPNILAGLFLSFFFGAIIGLCLMVFTKQGLKSQIPFAPFLVLGAFLAMVFGAQLVDSYLRFFIP